jgi:hypothetical protein
MRKAMRKSSTSREVAVSLAHSKVRREALTWSASDAEISEEEAPVFLLLAEASGDMAQRRDVLKPDSWLS